MTRIYESNINFDLLKSKKTQCKCPKCGKIYYKRIAWTGQGMPRIFCPTCAGKPTGDVRKAGKRKSGKNL